MFVTIPATMAINASSTIERISFFFLSVLGSQLNVNNWKNWVKESYHVSKRAGIIMLLHRHEYFYNSLHVYLNVYESAEFWSIYKLCIINKYLSNLYNLVYNLLAMYTIFSIMFVVYCYLIIYYIHKQGQYITNRFFQ